VSIVSRGTGWIGTAVAIGAAYYVIGFVFGALAGNAAGTAGRNRWRLAAWALSGIVFVTQIAYDRLRLRHTPATASLHAAAAAAVGGFLLALAATIHKAGEGGVDSRYLFALVAWPVIVAVPGFAAALIVSMFMRPLGHSR
jgi:hypothetical protein